MVRLALLAALVACKQRGTEAIALTLDPTCSDGSRIEAWFVLHGNCSSCGACDCCSVGGAACVRGCVGTCTTAELDHGLDLSPPGPGSYALVIELVTADEPGRVIAATCAQVEVDADGTMSETIPLTTTCCAP